MADEKLNDVDIWRAAIKDSGHERHKAAWALFAGQMEGQALARLLENQREQVIEWALPVLESDTLAKESALGGGYAPVNVVRLLGEWKVTAAIPALLKIIMDEGGTDYPSALLLDEAISALSAMPREVLPMLFSVAQTASDDQQETFASIIADICDGHADDEVLAWLIGMFETRHRLFQIEFMAEQLMHADYERGIRYLETVYLPKARPKAHADRLRCWIAEKRAEIGKKA